MEIIQDDACRISDVGLKVMVIKCPLHSRVFGFNYTAFIPYVANPFVHDDYSSPSGIFLLKSVT